MFGAKLIHVTTGGLWLILQDIFVLDSLFCDDSFSSANLVSIELPVMALGMPLVTLDQNSPAYLN